MQHIKPIDETALSDEGTVLDGQQNTAPVAVETKPPETKTAGVTAASSGVTTFSASGGSESNMSGDRQITNSLNRAGTGSYDLYSQNVKFVHHDMTVGHPSLPIEIYHVYNLEHANNTAAYCKTYCGNGWRTSYHQYIGSSGADAQGHPLYFYIDASGEKNAIIWKNGQYVLEKDENTVYNPVAKTLTNQQYVLNFDTSGWLSAQADKYGNVITIVYLEGKISKIISTIFSVVVQNQVNEISFEYQNNYMSRITHTTAVTKEIIYDMNFDYMTYTTLYTISYAAGSSDRTKFNYVSTGKLSSITDPMGHKLEYKYEGLNGGVSKIVETSGDSISDGAVTVEPVRTREWAISGFPAGAKYTRKKVKKGDITTVYVFDKGKCLFAYTDKSSPTLEDGLSKMTVGDELAISREGITFGKGKNYAESNFYHLPYWTRTGTASLNYNIRAMGCQSIMLTGNANGYVRAERTFTGLTPKKGYAVSCYAMISPSGSANKNTSFCFFAELLNSSGTVVDSAACHYDREEAYWQAGAVRLKGDGDRIRVTLIYDYLSGYAYFDGLRIMTSPHLKTTADDAEDGGKIITTINDDGSTSETLIDAAGLVKKQTNGDYSCSYEYDDDKRVKKTTDSRGLVTEHEYKGYCGQQTAVKMSHPYSSLFMRDTYGAELGIYSDTYCLVEWPTPSIRISTDLRTGKITRIAENEEITKYNYVQSSGDLAKIEHTSLGLKNEYYYTKCLLTKILADNNTILYSYDGFGQLKEMRVNGALVKTYAYKDDCHYTTALYESDYNFKAETISTGTAGGTYAQKTFYNSNGMPAYKTESTNGGSETELVRITYDQDKMPQKISDYSMGATSPLTQTFSYNADDSLKKINYTGTRTGSIEMIKQTGKRSCKEIKYGTDSICYGYDYDSRGNQIVNASKALYEYIWFNTSYDYDILSRPTRKYTDMGRAGYFDEIYIYEDKTGGETTGRIKSIEYNHHGSNLGTVGYTYHSDANISTETNIMGGKQIYSYDAAGRLCREDNEKLGFTKIYDYKPGTNGGGNISNVKVCAYSPNTATQNLSGTDNAYTYQGNTDKLSKAFNCSIWDYDLTGKPCSYRGNVLQWERGRRLSKYGAIAYKYDAAGIRQEKKNGTTTHTYYTEGSRIHREVRSTGYVNNNTLWYVYDQTGICGIRNNEKMYYFKKNLQGDVVLITDEYGEICTKYVYDAWGNHKVYNPNNTENTSSTFIGNINPFRYRGYYYDAETKLYYLNSRYYDPEIGRFINPDDISYLEPTSINGLNLYAYCKNNPVMFTDSTGYSWWDDFCNGWNNFWNGVGDYFANFGQKVSDIATTTWNSTVDFFSNPAVQQALMCVGSGLMMVGGVALTAFGIPAGALLFSAGISSLIGGIANSKVGGSFFAGWTGGLISGTLTAALPGWGAAAGGFFGSVVTDLIDNRTGGIDWEKAAWTGALSCILDIVPAVKAFGDGGVGLKSVLLDMRFLYRGALTALIGGVFNAIYGKK